MVSRGEGHRVYHCKTSCMGSDWWQMEPLTHLARLEKKCKKPLDKPPDVWYNVREVKGEIAGGNQSPSQERVYQGIYWSVVRADIQTIELCESSAIVSNNTIYPLTNLPSCDTIRVQKARVRQSQRERPTRVGKTFNPMTRPQGV